MKSFRLCLMFVLAAQASMQLNAEEVPDGLTGDDWTAAHGKIAERLFAEWKSTGNEPEDFHRHAVCGERADLIERRFSGDRIAETEIKVTAPDVPRDVTIQEWMPYESECRKNGSFHSVWRRITKDRFEIWTPTEGRLYDSSGKLLVTAKVHRGDGNGREWYGAFLPDGSWVTTDIDDRDDTLRMYSAKGKRSWSIKGGTLIPRKKDADAYESLPLIAWARSTKDGKAWVISVGSEMGRGWVRVTPDGKWMDVSCPWKVFFPQQLGPRGMYTCKKTMDDNGGLSMERNEHSHGQYVGWPLYGLSISEENDVCIPAGEKFGILPDAWSFFIEANYDRYDLTFERTNEDREKERVWLFDAKGKYQHWIKGHTAGSSLAKGGLWVVLPDDSCVRVDKGYSVGPHLKFTTGKNEKLVPLEIHDDIGLGLFLADKQLLLGKWSTKH